MMKNFKFNAIGVLVAFSFLLLCGKSNAGTFMNGECWSTIDQALTSFVSQYPKTDGGFLYSLTSPVVTGSQIQYVLSVANLASSSSVSATYVTDVSTCNDLLSVSPVIDSASVGYAFGWGFGVVVLFFLYGYSISLGLMAIKKV